MPAIAISCACVAEFRPAVVKRERSPSVRRRPPPPSIAAPASSQPISRRHDPCVGPLTSRRTVGPHLRGNFPTRSSCGRHTMPRARYFPSLKQFSLLFVSFLTFPLAARAVDLDVKIEPGVGLSLAAPQKDRFKLGGAATVKGLVGSEGGWFNVTAGLTFLGLPAQSGYESTSVGTAWAPSLGLRVQLPRESDHMRMQKPHVHESWGGAKPWMDGDFMYVRTGGLDRAGFAAAVGLAYPVGESRQFQIGPFVRYFQILQGNRAGYDNRDANTLILGVSLETGTRIQRQEYVPPAAAAAMTVAGPAANLDRDGDGVPNDVDACPDMP